MLKSTRVEGGHHRLEHNGLVWTITRHGASGKATRWRAEREQDGELYGFIATSLGEVKAMIETGRLGNKKATVKDV